MVARTLLDVLKSPGEAFRRILSSEVDLALPIAIVLVNGLLSGISSYYQRLHAMEQMRQMFGDAQLGALPFVQEPSLAGEVLRSLILAPIGWVVFTALILVMSRILGGRAGAKELLAVNGYAQVPLIIGGALGIAASVTAASFAIVLAFLFGLWSLGVLIIGVREANEFSTLKAVTSVIIPVLMLAAIFVVLFLGAMLALLGGGAPIPQAATP
jgi:hypothetical protein